MRLTWCKHPDSGPRGLRWCRPVPGLYAHYFSAGFGWEGWCWEVRWDVPHAKAGVRVFPIAYGTTETQALARKACRCYVAEVLRPAPAGYKGH